MLRLNWPGGSRNGWLGSFWRTCRDNFELFEDCPGLLGAVWDPLVVAIRLNQRFLSLEIQTLNPGLSSLVQLITTLPQAPAAASAARAPAAPSPEMFEDLGVAKLKVSGRQYTNPNVPSSMVTSRKSQMAPEY